MKNKLMTFLFFLAVLNCFGQNDSDYQYKVEYKMILSFSGTIEYSSTLYFNKLQSLFEYKDNYSGDTDEEETNDGDNNFQITVHSKKISYIVNDKQRNICKESFRNPETKNPCEVEESIPIISWNIEDETKLINQHHCQKATCNFRGRQYTVWFTPDIQTGFGPIKLNGLPGLILEVVDNTKEVILQAVSIKQERHPLFQSPAGISILTREQSKKIFHQQLKKLSEFGKALSSGSDRNISITAKLSSVKDFEMDFELDNKKE